MVRRYFIDRLGRITPSPATAAYIVVERAVRDGSPEGFHTSTRVFQYGSPVPAFESHTKSDFARWLASCSDAAGRD